MTNHDPIEINGTTVAPVPVACPACGAEIDAQRTLVAGACPECRTPARQLCGAEGDAEPPEDYEPESYTVGAQIDA